MFEQLSQAIQALVWERNYQDQKHGTIENHPHEVGAYLTLLRVELREAEEAWAHHHDDLAALAEIVQIGAVALACLEQHGIGNYHRDLEGIDGKR